MLSRAITAASCVVRTTTGHTHRLQHHPPPDTLYTGRSGAPQCPVSTLGLRSQRASQNKGRLACVWSSSRSRADDAGKVLVPGDGRQGGGGKGSRQGGGGRQSTGGEEGRGHSLAVDGFVLGHRNGFFFREPPGVHVACARNGYLVLALHGLLRRSTSTRVELRRRAHGGARRGGTITTFDREIFDCETADSENTPAGGKAARRAASCSACCDVGTMQATPPARQDTSSITRSITTVRCWRILDDHRGAFGVASSG
eukprot:scaffold17683_cov69-Phaeocystis_antarctica.AAC.6